MQHHQWLWYDSSKCVKHNRNSAFGAAMSLWWVWVGKLENIKKVIKGYTPISSLLPILLLLLSTMRFVAIWQICQVLLFVDSLAHMTCHKSICLHAAHKGANGSRCKAKDVRYDAFIVHKSIEMNLWICHIHASRVKLMIRIFKSFCSKN